MKNKIEQLEDRIKKLIRDLNLDISFTEVKKMIWEEKTKEDYHRYIGVFLEKLNYQDEVKINQVLQLLSDVWNNFPHKCLNGLSPAEKIRQFRKNE